MKKYPIFSSSIGKKLIMAVSGSLLLLFLFSHAAGNATLYLSKKNFQQYADTLHSHPIIVGVFSISILILFVLHVSTGIILFFQNNSARSSKYQVSKRVVTNSFASRTMIYSGAFVLIFVLIHVWAFTITKGETPISQLVDLKLSQFPIALFYLISFVVLSIHLSHGIFSMLQTFGVNHPRYNDCITRITYVIAVLLFVLFGGIPILFLLS